MKVGTTIFFIACVFFCTSFSFAQVPDLSSRRANCDVCGYCENAKPPGDWEACRKCLYPGTRNTLSSPRGIPTPDQNHFYTDLGCLSTQPGEFVSQIASFFFYIVGGIAFLYFLYGSFVLATSQGSPDRINYGKRIVVGSIVGLIVSLSAVLIIRIISSSLGVPGVD